MRWISGKLARLFFLADLTLASFPLIQPPCCYRESPTPPHRVGGRQAVVYPGAQDVRRSLTAGEGMEAETAVRHVSQRARFLLTREGSSRFSKAPPFLSIPRKLKHLLEWGGLSLGVRGVAKGGAQNVPASLPAGGAAV